MNNNISHSLAVGIDDMAVYLPALYLPISDLAEARNIEYEKLNKGLGLTAMAINDADEDAATMAANAVLELIEKNELDPRTIGRIYMGTESALDGAKPMASYMQGMLSDYFADRYGPDCLLNCDVVDLTFACIGAVDALQNTLDWVGGKAGRIGIVVASDVAKYELASTGEYTQGAGAVAVLVRHNPRLMAFDTEWGVATRSVHDFFKPIHSISKLQLVQEVVALLEANDIDADELLQKLPQTLEVDGILDSNTTHLSLHRSTPVFDGPYSNDCYQARIEEALENFKMQNARPEGSATIYGWDRLLFHLPYAFQARRMFTEIFIAETKKANRWEVVQQELPLFEPSLTDFENDKVYKKAYRAYIKAVSKTKAYQEFIAKTIARSERASSLVGNIYAGSLFLALMSSMEADNKEGNELSGKRVGFFAYGSGSKSKVFEGKVRSGWTEVTNRFQLFDRLKKRKAIDYATYEKLHTGKQATPILPEKEGFCLKHVTTEAGVRQGARRYHRRVLKKIPV